MNNPVDRYREAIIELDEPYNIDDEQIVKISHKDMVRSEKKAEGLTDGQLKLNGLILIVAILVVIVGIYIADTCLINANKQSSALLNSIFELFKFIAISLVGFVFARNIKDN